MSSWPVQLVKVARPGFWPTQLWFFLLPLGQREMFGSLGFWLGCVYVCFPLGLLLYGWNDLRDKETDRRNPRKDSWLFGACLDDDGLARLPYWILGVQVPFALASPGSSAPRCSHGSRPWRSPTPSTTGRGGDGRTGPSSTS